MLQTSEKAGYSRHRQPGEGRQQRQAVSREDRSGISGKAVFIYGLSLAIICSMLIIYIGQTMQITRLNYRINSLEQKLEGIEEQNHQLKLKMAQNSSLSRVEKVARSQLNMKEPEEIEVVVLDQKQPEEPASQTPSASQLAQSEAKPDRFFFLELVDNLLEGLNTVKAISAE